MKLTAVRHEGMRLSVLRMPAVLAIRLYRWAVSPFLPPACRFLPTCAEYAEQSFRRFPFSQAVWLSLSRLARCHPFHPGGYDPVPDGPQPSRRRR